MNGACTVERVRLHQLSARLAYAEIRLPWVNLTSLKVEQSPDGKFTLTPPCRPDAQGRQWPAYSLQPEARAVIEAEIARLWARARP